MPWEIVAASEDAVLDGKVSFSRSGSVSKSVNWLSLIVPNDANMIKEQLAEFKEIKYIPSSLQGSEYGWQYFEQRYDAAIEWIDENGHAVVSNGPFYLTTIHQNQGQLPSRHLIQMDIRSKLVNGKSLSKLNIQKLLILRFQTQSLWENYLAFP